MKQVLYFPSTTKNSFVDVILVSFLLIMSHGVIRGGSDWSRWSKVQGRTKTWTKKWTGGPFFLVLFLVMFGPFLREFGPFSGRFGPFFYKLDYKMDRNFSFWFMFFQKKFGIPQLVSGIQQLVSAKIHTQCIKMSLPPHFEFL